MQKLESLQINILCFTFSYCFARQWIRLRPTCNNLTVWDHACCFNSFYVHLLWQRSSNNSVNASYCVLLCSKQRYEQLSKMPLFVENYFMSNEKNQKSKKTKCQFCTNTYSIILSLMWLFRCICHDFQIHVL